MNSFFEKQPGPVLVALFEQLFAFENFIESQHAVGILPVDFIEFAADGCGFFPFARIFVSAHEGGEGEAIIGYDFQDFADGFDGRGLIFHIEKVEIERGQNFLFLIVGQIGAVSQVAVDTQSLLGFLAHTENVTQTDIGVDVGCIGTDGLFELCESQFVLAAKESFETFDVRMWVGALRLRTCPPRQIQRRSSQNQSRRDDYYTEQ